MAANEKPVYAKDFITHAGRIYRPGEKLDRMEPDVRRAALESGAASDSPREAETAGDQERARSEDVAKQIETRSEKRAPGRDQQ